ncbi:hypothetical protein ACFLRY_02630 [Bacteroidota bacterium]
MKTKRYFSLVGVLFLSCMILIISCKKDEDDNSNDPAPPDPCSWQTAFFDDFNRANGPIGPNYSVQLGWPVGAGGADIFNNQLRFRGEEFWAIRYTTPITDKSVRVSIKFSVVDSSNYNFSLEVFSKDMGNNWMQQEGYFGGISMTELSIHKMLGVPYDKIAFAPFQLKIGHSYKLVFTAISNVLSLHIEDLNDSSTSGNIDFTDTGTVPSGNVVSINGFNAIKDVNLFDDYLVEVCK